MTQGHTMSPCQCLWQFYRCNPVVLVSIPPQQFSSNVKMLITPQPDPGPCSFSRGKGKGWEVSCKLENTGYHHQKVGVNVKRSCCFTLKSTFSFCIINKQKTHHKQMKPKANKTKPKHFRAAMEKMMFFFLPPYQLCCSEKFPHWFAYSSPG